MRDITRARKQLVQERTRYIQRIQKVLEDANLKIDSFITDLLGKSGRAILNALVEGYTNPEVLVSLTSGRLKASRTELLEALRGRVTRHHRFMLKLHLRQIDQLDRSIQELETQARSATSNLLGWPYHGEGENRHPAPPHHRQALTGHGPPRREAGRQVDPRAARVP